jgi:DNA ligase (NAD+)
LRYRDGLLSEAVSRGRSGELGFVCTNNALSLLDVPHFIKGFTGEIRGEAVQTWEDFKTYSESEVKAGNEAPKHPRNVVTGTMRQENPKIVAERKIRFLAYKVMGHYEELPTEDKVNTFLSDSGFKIPFWGIQVGANFADWNPLEEYLNTWKRRVDAAPYFCDGIVISYNDRKLQQELGDSKTAPRYAKAFKWQNETAETKVLSIDWETGRTGKVCPAANIAPVDLGGATLSRATLHNVGYVRLHEVNVGSTIAIIRSGEIIPTHMETIESTGVLDIPDKCSACGSKLVEEQNKDKSELLCVNTDCSAQVFQRILYFITTVNIEHCGPAILKALYDSGKVKTAADLYILSVEDIATASSTKNIGTSTATKIVASIAANKEMELTTFIAALGINNVSKGTAERLVEKFGTLEAIRAAKRDDFIGIRDFGDTTIDIVYNGLYNNKELIDNLLKHITFKGKKMSTKTTLAGLKFVITGELTSVRDLFEARIVDCGGVLQSGVSKATSYLVVGNEPGSSKLSKAEKFGIKQITELS